jgi:hypothetical protein
MLGVAVPSIETLLCHSCKGADDEVRLVHRPAGGRTGGSAADLIFRCCCVCARRTRCYCAIPATRAGTCFVFLHDSRLVRVPPRHASDGHMTYTESVR